MRPQPLSPGADLDGVDLADVDLSGADGHDARVLECTFTACRLDGVRLDGARLVDTSWSRVRADELSLARTTWWDGALTDCRLGAVQAYGSSWTRVTVHGGKVDYLNLRESELVDVVLDGCVVDELALGGATVRRLELRGCTVRRLDVTAARLVDVDLRGLTGLQHIEGVAGLAGSTITGDLLLELAPALAEQLGIRVD